MRKILILDDEDQYIVSLRDFLHEFGYHVCIAMSSSQALEVIKEDKPDLVLFDYKLPDMDGEGFLKKAKEISPRTIYILITAWNDVATLERFIKLGVTDIMLKPIDLEKLLKDIKALLKHK
ncbi:MAG: response regulator [Candidatus Omnitrophota bacterium]